MSAGLQITRAEHSNCKLRLLASRCRDGAEVRRLLTLAMVLHGHLCSAAASCNSKDRQTLRDWVHRDNEAGVEGLNASPIPGRTPFLTARQRAELYELVVKGADLATAKLARWQCVDLQGMVKDRFSVEVYESTIGKWLHQLRLTRLQPRPMHPKKDPAAEVAFEQNFTSWLKRRCFKPPLRRRSRSGSRTRLEWVEREPTATFGRQSAFDR